MFEPTRTHWKPKLITDCPIVTNDGQFLFSFVTSHEHEALALWITILQLFLYMQIGIMLIFTNEYHPWISISRYLVLVLQYVRKTHCNISCLYPELTTLMLIWISMQKSLQSVYPYDLFKAVISEWMPYWLYSTHPNVLPAPTIKWSSSTRQAQQAHQLHSS